MHNPSRYLATIRKLEVKVEDFRRFCGVLPEIFDMIGCRIEKVKIQWKNSQTS